MNVTCIPLTEFVHGDISAHEGRPLQLDADTAAQLERDGLVRIRAEQVPAKKVLPGNMRDDGRGQPSSASPAAPASPEPTSLLSRIGGGRIRKAAT